MKIYCRNVAGLNAPPKMHQVINQCKKYDICMLQETKLTADNTAFLKAKWGNDHVYLASPGGPRRGVITLIHSRVSPVILRMECDPNGQFCMVLARIHDNNILITNVYGNPDLDNAALATLVEINRKIESFLMQFEIDSHIMAGDFNLVLEARDTNSGSRKPRAEAQLMTIINTLDLFDIAGLLSRNPSHTYFRHRREQTSARYDRFYISQNLIQGTKYKILPRTGDHAPIELALQHQQPHTSRWKFTDSLLTDASFVQRLHDTVQQVLEQYATNPQAGLIEMQNYIDFNIHDSSTVLSSLIEKIRMFCITETKSLRTRRREDEQKTITEFITARDALNNNPQDNNLLLELETAQEKMRIAQAKRHQKASEMNHVNYASLGERTTRYHFARSNRGRSSREIPKLIINENQGQRVLEGQEVQNHMFQKYTELAQIDPEACQTTIEDYLGQDLMNSLRKCPPEHHNYLTSPVLSVEIKNIVKELKAESAPGVLGITNSLMKELTPMMTAVLVDFGNKLLFGDDPNIPPWLFHRIVVFILKPGKPTTNPDSYRGLSMLEGFFKIFSKILANRMQSSMKIIQHPHQFGFTRGKGILEASRTVLDVIQHAKKNNLPLILVSTDFYKAFDSISIDHIENCLQLYEFPPAFTQAFMRLARNGTAQFEVNYQLSDDQQILKGTGQGDPKSSFGYNVSSAPLNHYLAESPAVPRYKISNEEAPPVFFADDAMLQLQGDRINEIIVMLQKISEFYQVSGLQLNLTKCEILTVNCNEDEVARLIDTTGMKRVNTLKHLGLHIDADGSLPHDKNIAPLLRTMDSLADSFNSNLSTPLGRSIYAKFILCSKYLHRIQNFHFTNQQLEELRDAALRLTWTRSRPGEDNTSIRVHIANNRVAQPLFHGGLSVPDPVIQSKSLSFSWARKFCTPNENLLWVKLLNSTLMNLQRPNIQEHVTMGPREWYETANMLDQVSAFWARIFRSIGNIINLSHTFDKNWSLFPILGNECGPDTNDISSLKYRNISARRIHLSGLVVVGQLFNTNQLGQVNAASIKSYDALEIEFGINIPAHLRNSITMMIRKIKQEYRHTISSSSQMYEKISTLQSLIRSRKTGCNPATRLLLLDQRSTWEWGPFPRSFSTYHAEGMVSITSNQFSKAMAKTRSNLLSPGTQWTSIQIFLRTLWTKVKEAKTTRNLVRDNPASPNCSNCGLFPERTLHLMYECNLAQQLWTTVITEFNSSLTEDYPDEQHVTLTQDMIIFNHIPNSLSTELSRGLLNIIMTIKHRIYLLRFRDNQNRLPSFRMALLWSILDIDKVVMVRQHNGINSSFLENFNNKLKNIVGL